MMSSSTSSKTIKHFTLVFILGKGDGGSKEVLLGFKKRGFGSGYWNGFGGKVEPNETYEQGAGREVMEECGLSVKVSEERKVGTLDYAFISSPNEILRSHIYLLEISEGEEEDPPHLHPPQGGVVETEEMLPKWWRIQEIPYASMWPDSSLWYTQMFLGQKISGHVLFNDEHEIVEQGITFSESKE